MTRRPICYRAAFDSDLDAAIAHYRDHAGGHLAIAFIDAVQAACRAIAEQPALGSPRHGHELGLPGLRTWTVAGFPWRIHYLETAHSIDLWRIGHARRDVPGLLRDDE
jgi:toxin ParE1/3/4